MFYRVARQRGQFRRGSDPLKPCPFCAEEIQEAAIKCKHCGEWLPNETVVFEVWLTGSSGKKIPVVKGVHTLTRLGLRESKEMVEAGDRGEVLLWVSESRQEAENTVATLREASSGFAVADIRAVERATPRQPPQQDAIVAAVVQEGVPHCPTCGSTKVRRISGGRKAARVAMIGVFAAPKAMKSYECLACKARW